MPCPLLRFFFLPKSKLVARKQGRCAEKTSAGKEIHSEIPPCFRRMGRAHRAPSHAKRVTSLHRNTSALRERTACPPGPRNEACLMVFARNPPMADFRAGECLKFNRSYAYVAKSESGQVSAIHNHSCLNILNNVPRDAGFKPTFSPFPGLVKKWPQFGENS